MLKMFFEITAIFTAFSILIGKIFIFGKQKPTFVGNYAAFVGALMGFYTIMCIVMLIKGDYLDKAVMLFFATSPYLIGKITTYKNLNFFTIVQIFTLIFSAIYSIYFID